MVEPAWRIAGKIQLRLIWPLTLLLLLNSLDRVNISFGALQMNKQIGLDASSYGLGISCFFLGYILFQAPSVWALKRWGARRWLFGIVVAWGSIATVMAFIRTPTDFYIVRTLLGFAESGFAPGVIYLAATWMPVRHRAAAIGTVMLAVPISMIVGGPLCAWLMEQANPLGVAGWRWMSLVEGSVTVVLAFACLLIFVDDPKDARWLSSNAKSWLHTELEREHSSCVSEPRSHPSGLIGDPRVWLAGGTWFALLAGLYGVAFWLPQIIRQLTGGSTLQISFIAATPWIASGLGTVLNARHSDRTLERFWHCGLALVLAAVGLSIAVSSANSTVALSALILCGLGLGGAQSVFWSIPPIFLGRANSTVGVPFINMIGNSSGVLVPYFIGVIRQHSGSFIAPVYALASMLLLGAVFTLFVWLICERSKPASTFEPDVIKPFHKSVVEDPEILHAQLRRTCPVALQKSELGALRSGWLVTRYEDIVAVARDTETFAQPLRWPGQARPPLESNPPQHRQFRALLQPFFMPKALALFEPISRRLATSMVSALLETDGGDLARGLARPLPPQVMLARLNQPIGDWERIKECSEASFLQGSKDPGDIKAYESANTYLWDYSYRAVADRKSNPRDPQDDLISAMLSGQIDGAPVEQGLIAGMVRLLLAAGHDSTTSALGICLHYLAQNLEAQAQLRANPAGIADAIEEILRVRAPVIQMPRVVTKDTELHGQALKAGERVLLAFASGNRDPDKFENADEYQLHRAPNRHLSFGTGIHVCIGNGLARQEIRVALGELLERTQMFGLSAEPQREFWHPYGLTRLIVWTRAKTTL